MSWVVLVLAIGALLAGLFSLLLQFRFARVVLSAASSQRKRQEGPQEYLPSVGVIVPCKGIDLGFDGNIIAVLKQDYPSYQVVFATAGEDDPAFVRLSKLLEDRSLRSAGLVSAKVVATRPSGIRAQKIDNQLRALKELGNGVDVYAFLDSDIRPHPDFLSHLVQPLQNPQVGVSTGYRWLVPKGGFWSIVASMWNAGSAALAADKRNGLAWGGAMAMDRPTFEKTGVRDYWWSAVSDDLALTCAVKTAGLNIQFVPQAIVASPTSYSFSEALEWTTRQMKLVRYCLPGMWALGFVSYGLTTLALLLGTAWGTVSYLLGSGVPLGSWLALGWLPLAIVQGVVFVPAIRSVLDKETRVSVRQWHGILAVAAIVLATANYVISLGSNVIRWRGVTYEIISDRWSVVRPFSENRP